MNTDAKHFTQTQARERVQCAGKPQCVVINYLHHSFEEIVTVPIVYRCHDTVCTSGHVLAHDIVTFPRPLHSVKLVTHNQPFKMFLKPHVIEASHNGA